jgi:hypothetical protein
LLEIPFWGITKTKITALQDFEERYELDKQGTAHLEQMLQQ